MDEGLSRELIALGHDLANAAKRETLRYFRQAGLATQSKLDDSFDPVTIADRAAEEVMRALIQERRPDDGILGEEFGHKTSRSGLTWVLDPIDGTRGYISGTPTWGTLIALHDGQRPIMGIIDQPYIGERFTGGLVTGGVGCADFIGPHGRKTLKASSQNNLADAVIFTTFPEVGSRDERSGFEDIAKRCKLVRYGMDCYAYGLLALGHVEIVIEAGLNPYDIQAPIAVVEAAGGVVTDWTGAAADQGGRVLACANADLHEQILEILVNYG